MVDQEKAYNVGVATIKIGFMLKEAEEFNPEVFDYMIMEYIKMNSEKVEKNAEKMRNYLDSLN